MRRSLLLFILIWWVALVPVALVGAALPAASLGVQAFLDGQPGPLKTFQEEQRSAAAIIESSSLYYGLSPRLSLALLETVGSLLSDPAPAAERLNQPFGAAGPNGFAAQIDWASRELRAGLGPYDAPPTLQFTDGSTITLTLQQAPEGVAVQRFLARGHSAAEWSVLVERFGQVFQHYFNNELVTLPTPTVPGATQAVFTLVQPWPAGVRAVHLAYFDHAYPTVDSGEDGNQYVVNYLGAGNVQYDGHDGHDYYFPAQPVGTPILAAAAGIAHARTHRGYGVVIQHPGGYETVYWHLDGFAPIFEDRIDSNQGVWVEAGTFLGTSGRTGFVQGTPHLHFEVRHNGREVDPYGWYGPGSDPCATYAGCGNNLWLWDNSLAGQFDFTRPDSSAQSVDREAPLATLAINPPAGLRLLVPFDGHALQEVGSGFPVLDGRPTFGEGRRGQGFRSGGGAELSYPVAGNLDPLTGTVSLWVQIPERYEENATQRHYLFAASADPADPERVYSGTLALRRDLLGPDGAAQWSFWSEGSGERDLLSIPDKLEPGWHHMAVTWDHAAGAKQLFIDGELLAETEGISLPTAIGPALQIGRFTYGSDGAGLTIDELAIYDRVLSAVQIANLAKPEAQPAEALVLHEPELRLDTNALDDNGGIVGVQLGVDGRFDAPQPYYDAYGWQLPQQAGSYEIAARYYDRAGNSTTVTRTVTLAPRPNGSVQALNSSELGVTLRFSTDYPEIQLSQHSDFRDAVWLPVEPVRYWHWQAGQHPVVYARFRAADGTISEPIRVMDAQRVVYVPMVILQTRSPQR